MKLDTDGPYKENQILVHVSNIQPLYSLNKIIYSDIFIVRDVTCHKLVWLLMYRDNM